MNNQQQGRGRRKPDRRFLRGAIVPDVEKLAQASQKKANRRHAKARKTRTKLSRILRSAVGLVLALLLVVWLISRLFITGYKVDNGYLTTVEDYFKENSSQRFKPLLSNDQLESYLQQSHPEISAIYTSSSIISNTLNVALDIRQPALIWTDFDRANQYLVDDSGVAYQPFIVEKTDELPRLRDDSGLVVELGTRLIAPSSISFIYELLAEFPSLALSDDYFQLGDAPQDIRVELTNRDYYLLFTTTRPLLEQRSALEMFLDSPSSRGVSQYIDVRVADKIFYK